MSALGTQAPLLFSTLLAFLLGGAGIASGGPNEGGTLVIHNCPITCFCLEGDQEDFCDPLNPPSACEEIITNESGTNPKVWLVYAAFPESSAPRLAGLTFGVNYDNSTVFLLAWGMCGDFELPNPEWPGPGEGNAVTFIPPRTGILELVYWFAGYNYYGTATSFDLIPHPGQGGWFGDDSIPSVLDPIADFGRLGFGADPGYLPCPEPAVVGACCIGVTCTVLTADECERQGGDYVGDGVPCSPNPCEPSPSLDASWGEVKSRYR